MFRELIEKNISYRGNVVSVGTIRPTAFDACRYMSLFMFDKDILPFIKANKSVKGYGGKVYADAFWIDVDYEANIAEAQESTVQIINRLITDYQVDPETLYIYFSGNKGFHLGILSATFGLGIDEPLLVTKDKKMPWLLQFAKTLTEGIKHIDFKIYEPVRIFRVPNSLHEKTSLYKIQLSFDELRELSMEEITALAKKPRQSFVRQTAGFQINKPLHLLWQDCRKHFEVESKQDLTGDYSRVFLPPKVGGRNSKLFVAACQLFKKSELHKTSITDIICCINECSGDPLPHSEIELLVGNAEVTASRENAETKKETLEIKSFGEWIPEWESYSLDEQSNMSLLFSELNGVMKGRLKGKLGVIMGYGGSKKSLFCLNTLIRNIKLTKEIGIYSTMEMSVPQLMNRIIDHEVNLGEINAHEAVVQKYRNDLDSGRAFMRNELATVLGNQLQITGNSRLTFEQYDTLIQRVSSMVGTPSVLVVDGLSMMGGKGSENDMYSKNSADLKELANKYNLFVMLVCHVSKGAELTTRDLSRNIRGSEKILDNCDFYMTMSQIADQYNPGAFRQDIGFINFKDKRGTGKSIDTLFSFDPQRLWLTENPEDPRIYRETKTSNTNGKWKSLIEEPF